MAPKFKVQPRGIPFPNTPLNVLIAEAEEKRRQRLEALASPTASTTLMPTVPKVVSKVNLMMLKPKATSKQVNKGAQETSASSSSSVLAKAAPKKATKDEVAKIIRRDKPVVKDVTRGDKKKALEIAATPDLLLDAISTFESEIRSSGDTSEYNVKTWLDIHEAVNWRCLSMYVDTAPLPRTPRIITVVGAVMKAVGYRSTRI